MNDILINQIQTPDGTILRSYHTHDSVSYIDKNGKYYAVDGGCSYIRRSFDVNDFFELTVLDHDPFEKIRLYWRTTDGIVLCELNEQELDFRLSHILKCDTSFFHYCEKRDFVIYVSLLLQERYYRKKFAEYSKDVKTCKSQVHPIMRTFFVDRLYEKIKDPFWECKFRLNTANHELMKLIWSQLQKYEWVKGNEFETGRILDMVLKPLEE